MHSIFPNIEYCLLSRKYKKVKAQPVMCHEGTEKGGGSGIAPSILQPLR